VIRASAETDDPERTAEIVVGELTAAGADRILDAIRAR
jgi:hypothetical protein